MQQEKAKKGSSRKTREFDLNKMSQEELDKTYKDRYSSGDLTKDEMDAA